MMLMDRFRSGDHRALAQAITLVEEGGPDGQALVRDVYAQAGRARIYGITGNPGAGKSTLISILAAALRSRGNTVAIVACDPTSPFSGGALLGDRIRMNSLFNDQGLFMRSLASRGQLGGLSIAAADVITLLDAFGFNIVLVETVGTGQSEVDIAQLAQATVVVVSPGLGDEVQASKAGILEIADIYVVNKADLDGADAAVRELEQRTRFHPNPSGVSWIPRVVKTIATKADGIEKLVDGLMEHDKFLNASGQSTSKARQRAEKQLRDLVAIYAAQQVMSKAADSGDLERLMTALELRHSDPYSVAHQLVSAAFQRLG